MTPHDQPLHSRAEVLRRGIAAAGLLAVGERVVPWLHTPAASATSATTPASNRPEAYDCSPDA